MLHGISCHSGPLNDKRSLKFYSTVLLSYSNAHMFYISTSRSRNPLPAGTLSCQSQSDRHGAMEQTRQKIGKLTDSDPNLVSSEGGQDTTSACQISGCSFHVISCERTETHKNEENQQTLTMIWSPLKGICVISMTNFRPFLPYVPTKICGNPQYDPLLLRCVTTMRWIFSLNFMKSEWKR